MSKPRLYGIFASPYVRKVRLITAYKGIDFKHEQTIPHAKDELFRAASPLGKIPAWRDTDIAISDSSVIAQYLEKLHPEKPLLPEAATGMARALWFEEYADSVMVPAYGAHLFAEVVLAPYFFKREVIQADIDKALNEESPAICSYIESQIDGKTWLASDKFSLADLSVANGFLLAYLAGHPIDAGQYPETAAWLENIFCCEPFASIIKADVASFAQMGWDGVADVIR